MSTESAVRIVWVYPDLLSTYGDRGNLLILAHRARRPRVCASDGDRGALRPAAARGGDIYLLGGGEDGPQALAAQRLNADRGLHRAVDRGAAVLAVCAGYQLVGHVVLRQGRQVRRARPARPALRPRPDPRRRRAGRHARPGAGPADRSPGSRTTAAVPISARGVQPLARVTAGVGNDGATEGVWQGRVLGTYMHGPALARNPALADLLLRWATGADVVAAGRHVADAPALGAPRRRARLTATHAGAPYDAW